MQIEMVITPKQAKEARARVGLSQAQVARETGISRTKLALFEVQKYLLADDELSALEAYFESRGVLAHGHVDTGSAESQVAVETGCQLLDGFAIPAGLDFEETERALAEIAENDQQIEALAKTPEDRSWLVFSGDKSQQETIVRMMARNYLLTRHLQGRAAIERSNGGLTNGDAVMELLGEVAS